MSGGLRARWREAGGSDDVEVTTLNSTPGARLPVPARPTEQQPVSALNELHAVAGKTDGGLADCASDPGCSFGIVLRKHGLSYGAIGDACVTGIDDAQHLFRTLASLAGHALIRRHAAAARRRPQPPEHDQPVWRVVVNQHRGCEGPGKVRIGKVDVEILSAKLQLKFRIGTRGRGVPAKIVNCEAETFGRCRTRLEQDRARVDFGGPEDRLRDRGQPWLGGEIATPIARRK